MDTEIWAVWHRYTDKHLGLVIYNDIDPMYIQHSEEVLIVYYYGMDKAFTITIIEKLHFGRLSKENVL